MKDLWNRLTTTQRYMVLGIGAFVVVLLLIQLIVFPVMESHTRAQRSLKANQKILKQLVPLIAEYGTLKQEKAQVENILSARPPGFNLFSFVEKRAGDAAIKSHVKAMNASKGLVSGPYEETAVDLKLEMITLKQLMGFIYLIESPMDLVRIKHFSVMKNKEKGDYLNATLQIITYVASSGDLITEKAAAPR